MRRPWLRKHDGWWYVTVNHRQHKLSKDKQQAHDLWQSLLAGPDKLELTVEQVLNQYLDYVQSNNKPRTYRHRCDYLKPFAKQHGFASVKELKAHHLTSVANKIEKQGARRAVVVSVKSAFLWAEREELIERNPFAKVKAPGYGQRTLVLDHATIHAILLAASPEFRVYLQALRHTGARPQELHAVKIDHWNARQNAWILSVELNKTGKKTERSRIIPLTPCLDTLMRIVKHGGKRGYLFTSPDGKPWDSNKVRLTFKRLRKHVPFPAGTSAYTFRHTFITTALVNGVDIATVAAIAGHSSTAMIDKHYGHLASQHAHLSQAVQQAVSPLPSQQSDQRTYGE